MYKKIIVFSLLLIANPMMEYCYAQEEPVVDKNELPDLAPKVDRNPFVPQIPLELLEQETPIEDTTVNPSPKTTETPTSTPQTPNSTPLPTTGPIIEKEKPIVGNPALIISGILWNSKRPQAIVNGNIIEIGDKMFSVPTDKGETIPQLEFVSISKEGVSVTYKDKTVVLNTGLEPPKGAAK